MQKSKAQQSQPKGKRTRAPRKKNQGSGWQSADSIPSGVSESMKQSFTWGGKPTKRMELRLAAYEIGAGASTTDGLRGISGVASQTSNVRLGLTTQAGYRAAGTNTTNEFLSPALDLEASSFTRFRCKRLRFQYCPQSGTNTTQRMVFAYANDPDHPLINTAVPSQAQLESVSDSIPFAPWKPWTLDVSSSLDKTSWLYTYDGAPSAGVTTDIVDRFNTIGVIGCMASANGTVTTGDVFGVLYIIADLEFKEFCPISVTRPALLRLLGEKLIFHARKREAQRERQNTDLSVLFSADDDDDSSSTSKPEPEPMHSKEFIREFQRLRKLGLRADECITSIRNENPNLSDEVNRLIESAFGGTAHASSSGRPDLVSTSSGHLSDTPRDIVQGKGKGKEN